ncbi:MAG: diamine N-acetyltransferase [Sphingomonadales bacterium]|jgi:GNAT superfamily N-acetyltransferase|nr:diamine N-acetyltransferase [Sphingomonadales bacterium]
MIRYRDAVPDDAPAIRALFETSFVDTFGQLYRREDLQAFLGQFNEEAWRAELAAAAFAFRLAEEGGETAAFAKLGPRALPVETARPSLELRQLYVRQAWQGRGIAQALMEWTLAEAVRRGAEELYLSVWAGNARAKRFYRGYGFTYVAPYAFMVGAQADEDEIWRLTL